VAAPKYADVLGPGKHGCTMGGNPPCAAAGAAAMKLIEDQDLVTRAADKGEYIMATLRAAGASCVKDVRGKGFMIGIEFPTDAIGYEVSKGLFDNGVLVAGTLFSAKTLRIEPPLTLTVKEMDQAVNTIEKVFREVNAKHFEPKRPPNLRKP
jgi:putrescine aminotransferase